jgi:4-amino-4-deoxy-L-arabinose transferase-like glycosyltransferase
MTSGIDYAAQWNRRRSETWRATRLWLLVALVAGVVMYLGPRGSTRDITEAQFTVQLVCLVVLMISMSVVIFAVRKHYRCPRCEAIPMSSWWQSRSGGIGFRSGVDLFPSVCPTCGAKLRDGE